MKIIISGFYYFLIFLGCLAGIHLAKAEGFVRETIFLIYVAMAIYAIAEIILKHIKFLKTKIAVFRVLFLITSITSSYFLFRVTDEMILEKELNASLNTKDIKDINIKPAVFGYLTNIKFKVSNEQFLDLVDTLEFRKSDFSELNLKSEEMKSVHEKLMKDNDAALCCEKDEDLAYEYYGTRYLIYDTETMTAYYEYENHKGVN